MPKMLLNWIPIIENVSLIYDRNRYILHTIVVTIKKVSIQNVTPGMAYLLESWENYILLNKSAQYHKH